MAQGIHGLLVIDKPGGLTSRDVVNRAQRWFPRGTPLGHTGTLDPLANGVLVLCVGVATRLTEYVQQMTKTYQAGISLGARSNTDDADGVVTPTVGAVAPDRALVEKALEPFIGEIDQVPPAFSAAKVAGSRAYDLARRGQGVDLCPRRVQVYEIRILDYQYPHLEVEVRCGKGTYIRSLARDLGESLGCGAHVQSLRRTRVGPFAVEDAIPIGEEVEPAPERLLPLSQAVANLPRVTMGQEEIARLRQGQTIPFSIPLDRDGPFEMAAFGPSGELVAVVRADPGKQTLRPVKVLMV